MTDNEIIARVLKGDRQEFRLLVEQNQQLVFRTCMGYLHNKDEAEDLTQEVFISAYKSLSSFKGTASFSTWICRIAINASLNKLRGSRKNLLFWRPEASWEKTFIQVPDPEDPEKIMIREEHIQWVKRALDSLPENQRTAIVLSKYDDLSQREISEIMNLSEGAVESLLQRAKKNLREKLSSGRKNITQRRKK